MKKENYEAHLNQISRTIEAKSDYKQNVLINRIQDSLEIDYRNLLKIENMEMTAEIGKVVRSQLRRIFSKLEDEGISFE